MQSHRPLTDQEQVRHDEVAALRALGLDPYPAATYPLTHTTQQALQGFQAQPDHPQWQQVHLAGRIIAKNIMGKASFARLHDAHGRLQIYLSRDDFSPQTSPTGQTYEVYNDLFKRLTSLGDYVGVEGFLFTTKTGETTLHVRSYTILAKALRPLPLPKEKDGQVYDAFTDAEQRHRMRYVDLAVNPHVRETFRKRTAVVQAIRQFLNGKDYLEVETPILQPIYGGATARPFTTHHNTLDTTLYLRIANELYLKRLMVGGLADGVYEFAKDFRNEGMSRFHNPEFTMLEVYVAYKDYRWMMELVEEMVEHTALAVHGSTQVQVGEHLIDFRRPWQRLTFYGAIAHYVGQDVTTLDEAALRQLCRQHHLEPEPGLGRDKLLDELFSLAEKQIIQPTFITDYPVEMSPLAKRRADAPELVERFEAICNAKEICNAFSELNDPLDQRGRFEAQLALRARGDDEAMVLDEDFLRALEYGMPPTAGLGVGIDRLTMILTNQPSIQEVLLFPQMRPEFEREAFLAMGIPVRLHGALQKQGIMRPEDMGLSQGQHPDAPAIIAHLAQLGIHTDNLD